MRPSSRTQSQGNISKDKMSRREYILSVLQRISDKDTQKGAAEDLKEIIHELDSEHLPVLISGLCSPGLDHKPYARKECIKALVLVASDACPVRHIAMGAPHVTRILTQIKKSLQDTDSGVRDVSAGFLATCMVYFAESSGALQPGSMSHPVVKIVFECLNEQKKEAQSGAAYALGMISPYLGPLDKDLVKDLLRLIRNNAFQATSQLLLAIASCDEVTGDPGGLMKVGSDAFLPVMSKVMGSASGGSGPSGASGVLSCLKSSDWQVRKAAAEMVKSTALLLGPQLEVSGIWDRGHPDSVTSRCLTALEGLKFDRVKQVRDSVTDAIAALSDLLTYGKSGGTVDGWREMCDLTPVKANPPVAMAPNLAPSRSHIRQSSVQERFRSASPAEEVVVLEPPMRQRPQSAAPALQRRRTREAADQGAGRPSAVRASAPVIQSGGEESGPGGEEAAVGDSFQQDNNATGTSDVLTISVEHSLPDPEQVLFSPAPPRNPGYVQVAEEQWSDMQQRLQALESLSLEVQELRSWREQHMDSYREEQERISMLEEKVEALEEQLTSAEANAVAAAAAASATPTPTPQRAPSISIPVGDPSPSPIASPYGAAADSSSLGTPGSSSRPGLTPTSSRMRLGSIGSPGSQTSEDMVAAHMGDIDATYSDAMRSRQIDLLRLMTKHAPAWQQLQPETSVALLERVADFVEHKVQVGLMLKWVWRVADDSQELPFEVPHPLRTRLAACVAEVLQTGEAQEQNAAHLLDTLVVNWGVSDPRTAANSQLLGRPLSNRRLSFSPGQSA